MTNHSSFDDDLRAARRDMDETELDALVDGSLDEPERRALLLRLESTPEGWRRCALAFLEAQAWREALGAAACQTPTQGIGVAQPVAAREARVASSSRYGPHALWAAAVALAFLGGWGVRGVPVPIQAPAHEPIVASLGPSIEPATRASNSNATHMDPPTKSRPRPSGEPEWSTAGLVLPLAPPALPERVRDRLVRNGYRVREHTALSSIALDDGRRVAVPVGQVRLEYVGSMIY